MLPGYALDVGFRHVMLETLFPCHAAPAVHVDAMWVGYTEPLLKRTQDAGYALRPWIRKMEARRAGHMPAAGESIPGMGSLLSQISSYGESVATCSRVHVRQREIERLACRLSYFLVLSTG